MERSTENFSFTQNDVTLTEVSIFTLCIFQVLLDEFFHFRHAGCSPGHFALQHLEVFGQATQGIEYLRPHRLVADFNEGLVGGVERDFDWLGVWLLAPPTRRDWQLHLSALDTVALVKQGLVS